MAYLFNQAVKHIRRGIWRVHTSHKARDDQSHFIERFLSADGTVACVEKPSDAERVPVRVQ